MPEISEMFSSESPADLSASTLQVSSSSPPEPEPQRTRALSVKKNVKQRGDSVGSRTSSSGSSRASYPRPPSLPVALPSSSFTHRGPLESVQSVPRAASSEHEEEDVDMRSAHTPHVFVSQHNELHQHDQRSIQVDQRQVNVGLDPSAVHAREDGLRAEAYQAVQTLQQHVVVTEAQAKMSLQQATHEYEKQLRQTQHEANLRQQQLTEQLIVAERANQQLRQTIEQQSNQLEMQKHRQEEFATTIATLQNQLTFVRHEAEAQAMASAPPGSADLNGADFPQMHAQLLSVVSQLSQEVRELKAEKKSASKGERKSPVSGRPEGLSNSTWQNLPHVDSNGVPFIPLTPMQAYADRSPQSACAGIPPADVWISPKKEPDDSSSSSTCDDGPAHGGSLGPGGSNGGGSGRGVGGSGNPFSPFSPAVSLNSRRSAGVGSFVVMSESDVYKSKDLAHIKIESLPANAAAFRGWKNALLTKVSSIDMTGQDIVLTWLLQAFGNDEMPLQSSGFLPRLDAHLSALLADSKHLKSEIGMRLQSYIESCQMQGKSPKGRHMLWLISQQFRLDMQRGATLTQQSLLELELAKFDYEGLKQFVERSEYILNAIPQEHQPTETTKFTWLFGRLKRCRLLQRHIDRVKDSKPASHVRSFDWLFGKLKDALWELREDMNEESIRASLSTTKKEKEKTPASKPATPATESKHQKDHDSSHAAPAAKAKAKVTAKPRTDPKGKAKGEKGRGKSEAPQKAKADPKGKGREEKTKADGDKPKVPCLFYPKGTCNRGENCPFAHEENLSSSSSAAKAKPKPQQPTAKASTAKASTAKAAVAFAVTSSLSQKADAAKAGASVLSSAFHAFLLPFKCLFASMALMSESLLPCGVCTTATHTYAGQAVGLPAVHRQGKDIACAARQRPGNSAEVEWIADSGASSSLVSMKELNNLNIDVEPTHADLMTFETGNGTALSDKSVVFHGSSFGSIEHRVLNECPLVRSMGEIVAAGKPFVWMPNQLPFFVEKAEDLQIQVCGPVVSASRVEDNVPFFKEEVQFESCPQVPRPFAYPVGEVAASEEPSPVVEPGRDTASDADSERDDEEPFSRAKRLQMEAQSLEHRMSHIPKNRYCPICQRAKMYKKKTQRVRHDSLMERGGLGEVSSFGERLAVDFVVVSKSGSGDKEAYALVCRDEFSGFLRAFPCANRHTDTVTKHVLDFLGPSYSKQPTILCKSDCAPEFSKVCAVLGMVHEPSLARRWPHNSVLERDIRTLEECARAVHLGAGFQLFHDLWPYSVAYAALSMNMYHQVKGLEGTRHFRATGEDFVGRKAVLGQLVYVRRDPLNRHKFEASAVPGLFAGWRLDAGPKSHRGVFWVIEYASLKDATSKPVVLSVPSEEMYIPPGECVMPLAAAAEHALANFTEPALTPYLPKEIPFSSLPTDARKEIRHEYITMDRIVRFGATPDCTACSKMSGKHNSRCKARFDALVKAEKAARVDKKGPHEILTDEVPKEFPKPLLPEPAAERSEPEVDRDALPFSAGIPPGSEEARALAGIVTAEDTQIDDLFLQMQRDRSLYRRTNQLKGQGHLFEYACSPDSLLGQECDRLGVGKTRLCRDTLDLTNHEHMAQLMGQAEEMPGADAWVSITCTYFSPLQNLNIHVHGKRYAKKLEKNRDETRVMLAYAMQFIETIM